MAHKFGRYLKPLGVNAEQFDLIVDTKFTLANRSTNLGFGGLTNQPSTHSLRNSLLFNVLIGAFLCLLLVMNLPPAYSDTAYMATLMLIVFMTQLSGYSTLMLDPKDRAVFTTRGVNAQTLNAARIAVVGWYLLLNVVTLGAPALVPVGLQSGIVAAVLFAIAELLLAVFCLVLALLVYLLVLRVFDGERLKNLLNFLQIAMIVGAYVASQVLPRIGAGAMFSTHGVHLTWTWLLTPPAWFAGLPLLIQARQPLVLVAAGLAIVVPALGVWFYARHAARFEQYLAKLDTANGESGRVGWYYRLCAKILVHDRTRLGYFTLGWQLLRQEREYKLRVYPQFAYALVVPVVFALNFARDGGGLKGLLVYLPYLAASIVMAIPVAAINLRFSEHPEAMRVFQYVPFDEHGDLVRGITQAMYCRLVLPLTLVFGGIGLVAGWNDLLTLPAMLMGLYAASLFFGRSLAGRSLPFAQPFDPKKNATSSATMWPILAGMPVALGVIFAGGKLNAWWFALVLLMIGVLATWWADRQFGKVYFSLQR